MEFSTTTYLKLLGLHVLIAALIFYLKFLAVPWCVFLFVAGNYLVFKSKNQNNEVLLVAAYFVGSEVFLRMTDGFILYETGKYAVIYFVILGLFFSGFSKYAWIYFLFLFLLIPGLLLSLLNLNETTDIRKAIAFNISGPVCLAFSAIYCFKRIITYQSVNQIILALLLPIVSTLTYIFLYAPDVKKMAVGTESNAQISGGWAANQVATMLGLGLFCVFVRLLLMSKNWKTIAINLLLLILMAFRGIATFSRGGMFTSFAIIFILIIIVYLFVNATTKFNIIKASGFGAVLIFFTWSFISFQTNGLIDKRYANKDRGGRMETSRFTGREVLFEEEINFFYEHPIFGIGVGKSKEIRFENTGNDAATHSEISRMLAEHGLFGVVGLLLLIFIPFVLYLDNKQHIYFLSFYFFWFLTINHAAMRLAAPAFLYGLTLLSVRFEKPAN